MAERDVSWLLSHPQSLGFAFSELDQIKKRERHEGSGVEVGGGFMLGGGDSTGMCVFFNPGVSLWFILIVISGRFCPVFKGHLLILPRAPEL